MKRGDIFYKKLTWSSVCSGHLRNKRNISEVIGSSRIRKPTWICLHNWRDTCVVGLRRKLILPREFIFGLRTKNDGVGMDSGIQETTCEILGETLYETKGGRVGYVYEINYRNIRRNNRWGGLWINRNVLRCWGRDRLIKINTRIRFRSILPMSIRHMHNSSISRSVRKISYSCKIHIKSMIEFVYKMTRFGIELTLRLVVAITMTTTTNSTRVCLVKLRLTTWYRKQAIISWRRQLIVLCAWVHRFMRIRTGQLIDNNIFIKKKKEKKQTVDLIIEFQYRARQSS